MLFWTFIQVSNWIRQYDHWADSIETLDRYWQLQSLPAVAAAAAVVVVVMVVIILENEKHSEPPATNMETSTWWKIDLFRFQ